MNKAVAVLAGGFAVGVLARSFWDFGWSFAVLFVFLGLILVGIFIFSSRAEKSRKYFLFTGLFLFVVGLGIIRFDFGQSKNSGLENKIGSKITVSGTITEESDEKENYTRLILEENQTKNKILIVSGHYPVFRYGDKIEIFGKLQKPEKISDFDWPAYLAKDDIYYEMFYPQINLLSTGGGFWLKRVLYSLKEKFIENISRVVPEPDAGYLAGLTVGGKKAISKDLQEEFRRAGIIHVVVLSGYNVTIVASVIMGIFRFLPFYAGTGLGMLGILLFALMAGASATVVRASFMACLVLLAKATGRIYHITIALLTVGFLMILQNPKILRFDSSFQLSFLATLALIYVSPYVEQRLKFIPKKFHLREIVGSTISTQIFVLPFLLYKMGLFSVVALPVNLLVLIFVPVTMFFGFSAGIAGFISQILALPFGWLAYTFSAYELWIVNVFSKMPFAAFNISIPFWLMLLIYAAYIIVLLKINRHASLDKK